MARQGSLSGNPSPSLRIGEVARRTGLPVKTIRYYCDEGLLQPRARSSGGYRLFDEENLAELAIIQLLGSERQHFGKNGIDRSADV